MAIYDNIKIGDTIVVVFEDLKPDSSASPREFSTVEMKNNKAINKLYILAYQATVTRGEEYLVSAITNGSGDSATATNQATQIANQALQSTIAKQDEIIAAIGSPATEAKQDTMISNQALQSTVANQLLQSKEVTQVLVKDNLDDIKTNTDDAATETTLAIIQSDQSTMSAEQATALKQDTLITKTTSIDDKVSTEAKQDIIITNQGLQSSKANQLLQSKESKQDTMIVNQGLQATAANQVAQAKEAKQDDIIANQILELEKLDKIHEELASKSSNMANIYATTGLTSEEQNIAIKNNHVTKDLFIQNFVITMVSNLEGADKYLPIWVKQDTASVSGTAIIPILTNRGGITDLTVSDDVTTGYDELMRIYGSKDQAIAIDEIIGLVLQPGDTLWIQMERSSTDINAYGWKLKLGRDE